MNMHAFKKKKIKYKSAILAFFFSVIKQSIRKEKKRKLYIILYIQLV